MFNPKFTLTFFVYAALVFSLVASSEAHIQNREHVNHKRLLKKRAPSLDGSLLGGGDTGGGIANNPPPPSITPPNPSTPPSAVSPPPSTTQSSSSSSSDSSSSSSSSSSSTSSTGSSTSSTTSTASSSSTTSLTLPTLITDSSIPSLSTSTTLSPSSSSSSTAPTTLPTVQPNAPKSKSTTLTVLVAAAASVGAVVILWTIFRKWKLGRSAKFDERLQPIDWQPTNPEDGAIPGNHRRHSGASSFHSGTGHGNGNGAGRGYGQAPEASSAYAIPDHDFTAPAASLAPVGGYADLARGPSPQPQMHQMSHGPSMGHPAYDVGVPLHHQVGYAPPDVYDYSGARRY